MSSDNDRAKGADKNMKAEGREDHNGMEAKARRDDRKSMKAEGHEGPRRGREDRDRDDVRA